MDSDSWKPENFKVFEHYYLIPNSSIVESYRNNHQITSNNYSEYYVKFSNLPLLKFFAIAFISKIDKR